MLKYLLYHNIYIFLFLHIHLSILRELISTVIYQSVLVFDKRKIIFSSNFFLSSGLL